ncbi:cholesteryl ester transfer protein isoform X2 [Rhinatrema bivittatum]|uniref:cholesteryl ester transfer protein isoform X2 n=1 Tax=Rhinatrema bivittatum TaxID=194408 RepID=UPI00112B421B|nr:cholesteryl ester transfer protein isoform X2 [Rhinatrema bivittatum]
MNKQTAQVIQAAFKHATYPDINGERAVKVLGKVTYGLNNIQINDLTIENSEVDLKEDHAVNIMIQNVSASFKGILHYGYGGWFVNIGHSIEFEIESAMDLHINTELTCRNDRVAVDTSDCYLTFHKLLLHLHGDKQPGWIQQLFTRFISFTLKLVLKSQICKEINHVASLLADFIQDRAENFLHDGDIGVDISVTSFPIIKANYMESHHKGLLLYKNYTVSFNESLFAPSLLTESRMLYFWFSEQVLNSLVMAAFLDGRLTTNITGEELKEMLESEDLKAHRGILKEIFCGSLAEDGLLQVWGLTPPETTVTLEGTVVKSSAAVQLSMRSIQEGSSMVLYFETEVIATIMASYVEKKLILHLSNSTIYTNNITCASEISANEGSIRTFLQTAINTVGIPAVISRLEPALTALMNSKGLHLFEISNPEIITKEGYLIVQLDFAFPHHLLVDFLKAAM